jgi:hypothetical protein
MARFLEFGQPPGWLAHPNGVSRALIGVVHKPAASPPASDLKEPGSVRRAKARMPPGLVVSVPSAVIVRGQLSDDVLCVLVHTAE